MSGTKFVLQVFISELGVCMMAICAFLASDGWSLRLLSLLCTVLFLVDLRAWILLSSAERVEFLSK